MNSHYISLTFDDALDTHLDRAVPVLESNGLRGTFFVNINSPSFAARLDEWRSVAARKHELGNHTIFHPAVSTKSYISEGNALENYTLDRMRKELETANMLLSGLDGQYVRSFAYPCCNTVLGRPGVTKQMLVHLNLNRTRLMGWVNRFPFMDVFSSEQDYSVVASDLFCAARIGGERFSADSDFPPQRYAVPCISADGRDMEFLRHKLKEFRRTKQGWLVLMFHGIGGGHHLSCSEHTFSSLIQEIAADSHFLVEPFGEIAVRLWDKECQK